MQRYVNPSINAILSQNNNIHTQKHYTLCIVIRNANVLHCMVLMTLNKPTDITTKLHVSQLDPGLEQFIQARFMMHVVVNFELYMPSGLYKHSVQEIRCCFQRYDTHL